MHISLFRRFSQWTVLYFSILYQILGMSAFPQDTLEAWRIIEDASLNAITSLEAELTTIGVSYNPA